MTRFGTESLCHRSCVARRRGSVGTSVVVPTPAGRLRVWVKSGPLFSVEKGRLVYPVLVFLIFTFFYYFLSFTIFFFLKLSSDHGLKSGSRIVPT